MGRVAPSGSSPRSRLRKMPLVDSQAHIETHQDTIVNVRDGSKASFWLRRGAASGLKVHSELERGATQSAKAIPAGIRREPCPEFLRQRIQTRGHVFPPAASGIVQRPSAERRVTGAKDHGAVDEIGTVDDALAQAGDADVRYRQDQAIISGVGCAVAGEPGGPRAFSALPFLQR